MYLKGVENSQTKYASISEIEDLRFFRQPILKLQNKIAFTTKKLNL